MEEVMPLYTKPKRVSINLIKIRLQIIETVCPIIAIVKFYRNFFTFDFLHFIYITSY